MARYVLCPRCELNYIDADKQEYCDVCIKEMQCAKTFSDDLEEEEETEEEESERIILPTFRLSEEEIERGKAEFEPPKPKKKKKPHGGDDAGAYNGGADESGSDGAENGDEDGRKK